MRSPRFSRISALRPSQTTIQSPVPIFIFVIVMLRCKNSVSRTGSQMLFEILEGFAELRHRLLQIVSQHRRPDQVGCGAAVMGPRRCRAEIAPVVEFAVATAEPHQGDEVDLLVDIQPSNKTRKF